MPDVVVVFGVTHALRRNGTWLWDDVLPEKPVEQRRVRVPLRNGRLPLHEPHQLRLRQLVYCHPRDLEPSGGVRGDNGAVA
eukprot:3349142-Pyramimonas_sp.AAC.1